MKNRASIARAIWDAASGGLKGAEAERYQEYAVKHGTRYSPTAWTAPWSDWARRDFGVTAGANLIGVDTDTANPIDVLRPVTRAIRLGANVLPGQVADISMPKFTTPVTQGWVADDFTAYTASDPVYSAVTGSSKLGGSLVIYSHQFNDQADPEEALRRHIVGGIGDLIDQAVFAGTGASGQPEGIASNSDVDAQAGAGLAWSGVLDMIEAVELANGTPTGWVAPPAVAKILRNRVKFSGTDSPIWEGGQIDGTTAVSTTNAPAASLIVGDFSTIAIPIWGDVEVAVDPSTYFSSGKFQMRVLVSCDVLLLQANAFSIATSVT